MSDKISKKLLEAAVNRKVYEYTDGEGHLFYSFYQAPNIISPPTRLKLRSRQGVRLINFVAWLRRLSEILESSLPDEG